MSLLDSLRRFPLAKDLSFSSDEYARRLREVRASMSAEGLSALVVSNAANLCWITGYDTVMPSGPSTAIVTADDIVVVCPDLEVSCFLLHTTVENYRLESWQSGDAFGGILASALAEVIGPRDRVGLELSKVDAYAGPALEASTYLSLAQQFPDVTWVDVPLLISTLRLVKSDEEIAAMRVAGEYTHAGMRAALDAIGAGATENDVLAACYEGTIAAGSEVMPIDPMIVAGDRGGYMPFLPYRNAVLQEGDCVYLESSGAHRRYSAPLMRTASVGEPTEATRLLADLATEVVDTLMATIRPGRTGGDIAQDGLRVLKDLASDTYFPGTFGYACGLGVQPTWTEAPFYLAEGSENVVLEQMTIHLPICLWSPRERVGVGMSETILVTAQGTELITPGHDRGLVIR
ncbi:M24 family metallopeptidase [Micromonospora sp. NPDC048830]|uniref:M24 family metallopeptidase n=1 Tax=Micromonospora sp. NPDC048830 TaxID=3364257 RepID=UPI003723F46A